jgi:hypothetical protein
MYVFSFQKKYKFHIVQDSTLKFQEYTCNP